MPELSDWQIDEANNNNPPPNGAPENSTSVAEFNNIVREVMAVIARDYRDNSGQLDSGGTGGAYTITSNRTIVAYARGQRFAFMANHSFAGAATVNVNGIGSVALVDSDGNAVSSIQGGRVYLLTYDGTQFQVLGLSTHGNLSGGPLHADATTGASGFMSAADKSKLDGVEASAAANQTAAEIKAAYEGNSNTNAFTDSEQSKLAGIPSNAAAPQDANAILSKLLTVDGAGSGLDADRLDNLTSTDFVRSLSSLPSITSSNNLVGTDRLLVLDGSTHRYLNVNDAGTRVVSVTASKTLVLDDSNTIQDYAGSGSVTLTVVNGNHNLGTEIAFSCSGAGTILINSASAVSINGNKRVSAGGMAVLVKLATTRWILAGNLEA